MGDLTTKLSNTRNTHNGVISYMYLRVLLYLSQYSDNVYVILVHLQIGMQSHSDTIQYRA